MKPKRYISVLLAVVFVLTIFALPTGAVALTSSKESKFNVTWTKGNVIINEGVSPQYGNADKWLYSNTLDVSSFSHLKFTNAKNGTLYLNVVYVNANNKIIGSYTPNNSVKLSANTTIALPFKTDRVIIEIYNSKADAAVSDGNSVSIFGILQASSTVIDTNKKGTLNVFKYETDDITKTTGKGTGEQADQSKVAAGAKPLSGVTFTIKRIANVESKYYNSGEGNVLPTVEQAKNMTALESYSATTTGTGFAEFKNLPLGIYLVQETSAPKHVTQPIEDFVVSVPSTYFDGSGWNYKVYMYPKNETKYTDFSILKKDYATGNPLQGAEFKVEIAIGSNEYQTFESELLTGSDGIAKTKKKIPVNNYYRISETKSPSEYIYDTSTYRKWIYVDKDGNIRNGSPSGAILNSSNPTVLEYTNTKPTIKKWVDTSKGKNEGLLISSTIGHSSLQDRNYYTIEVTTPNIDMKNLDSFVISDFLNWSSQEPKVESVSEKGGSTLTKGSNTYDTTVEKKSSSEYNLSVNFNTSDSTEIKKNTTYYISVSTLTVPIQTNVGNTATLEYTSDLSTKAKTKISSDTTYVRCGAYQFMKKSSTEKSLGGAEFKLYKSEQDAQSGKSPISAFDVTTGKYTDTFVSNNSGIVEIRYLEYGNDINGEKDYYLLESKAPKGYSLNADVNKITVNKDSFSFSNTNMVIYDRSKLRFPLTGSEAIAVVLLMGTISIITAILLFYHYKKQKNRASLTE